MSLCKPAPLIGTCNSLTTTVCSAAVQPYLRNIFMLIFTRLQQSKTDKFVQGFLQMLMFAFALGRPDLPPDTIIGVIDGIQAGFVCSSLDAPLR